MNRDIDHEVLIDATACTARAHERRPMDNCRVVGVGITGTREPAPVTRHCLRERPFGRIERIAHEQRWTEVVPEHEVHIYPVDDAIGDNRIDFVIERIQENGRACSFNQASDSAGFACVLDITNNPR